MTVKEVKKLLEQFPEDMEIVNERCSDYQIISENEWCIVKGVAKDGWIMRSHPTMSQKNKQKEKDYLSLAGN